MTRQQHQEQILSQAGFNTDVTEKVKEGLRAKTTEVSQVVLAKIEMCEGDYRIYASNTEFVIISDVLKTRKEQNQISQILSRDFVNLTIALGEELWLDWLSY